MVVAISEFTKSKLVEGYNIDPEKVKVIHNALDERHSFEIDWDLNFGKGKKVMFLGRAVVQKGIDTFIEVASRVLEKLPDTTFIFAGDGDKLPNAIERVCDLGIQESFIFTGSVDRYHGDALYKNSDLFLLTSISEPFGITALESIRQGTPVVVSKASGVSEVLPNALSVDFWDIDRFADYVINILSDDTLYNTLRENQTNDYTKLTWKNQVDKLVEIFNTVVETAHGQ
jgi:glycosyltransferase involved in cell wall biosynthesis